jgi:hypothetical protein
VNERSPGASLRDRARRWLKRFPTLVGAKKNVQNTLDRFLYKRHISLIDRFQQFAPNSDGSYEARAELTVLAANQTFPFLAHFLGVTGRDELISNSVQARDLCPDEESKGRAALLKRAFDTYGSDKASFHEYHFIYAFILRHPESVTAVLEIGLGTNNKDVVSHMGREGRPGASLRAFRDFLPKANIYGADVDSRILFEDDRIETFFVDQTDLKSFDALGNSITNDFDLIIDDGLHAPNANIATLSFALSRLKSGGWLVVEDIPLRALPIWQVVAALLPTGYEPHLIFTKATIVFAVERMHDC